MISPLAVQSLLQKANVKKEIKKVKQIKRDNLKAISKQFDLKAICCKIDSKSSFLSENIAEKIATFNNVWKYNRLSINTVQRSGHYHERKNW